MKISGHILKLIGSKSTFVPYILVEDSIFFGLIKRRKRMYVVLCTYHFYEDISKKEPYRSEQRYCLTEIYYSDSCYAETIETASSILETVFLNNGMELLIQEALNK